MTLTLREVAPGVAAFLRWWGAELMSAVPVSWRGQGGRGRPTVTIWIHPDETIIECSRADGGERYRDAVAVDALDDGSWADLAELGRGSRCRLILAPPDIFTTQIRLPKAARSRLAGVVELQLDEIAPIPRERLHWALGPVVVADEQLSVTVVMAKRNRLAQLAALLDQRASLEPTIVAAVANSFVTLRRPAEDNGWRVGVRVAWQVAAIMLATPIMIWLVATCLAWTDDAKAAVIADAARQRLAVERVARVREKTGQAIARVARVMAASHILDTLAERLPADVTARAIAREPSGALALAVATADPDTLRPILANDPLFRFTERDQIPEEGSGRVRVSLRGTPR